MLTAHQWAFAQNNYQDMWKQYDQAINKGKTRDALDIAQKIFDQSEKDGKVDQKYKSIIHIYKNRHEIEEKSEALIVQDLKSQITKSKKPEEKALYQMLLAYSFQTYFDANRYKIDQRTLSEDLSNDFTFWDSRQFKRQISDLYLSALKDGESLKKVGIKEYSDVLNTSNQKSILFTSVYDVLVYTSAQYFLNVNSYGVDPDGEVSVEEEFYGQTKYLVPLKDFLKLPISVNAKSSKEKIYQSLMQKWLTFHQQDTSDILLAWIDDWRLNNTLEKVWGEEKSTLYLNILSQNQKTYSSKAALALFAARELVYKYDQVEDADKMDRVKVHKAAQELIKKYPNTYGAEIAQSLMTQIESKEFSISLEQAIYPVTPFKVFAKYRNVPTIQYKIFSGEIKDSDLSNLKIEERWKALNKMKLVRDGKINLPGIQDYNSHSVEIPMKGIESGQYVILFYTEGIEKDFSKGKFHYATLNSTALASNIIFDGENYVITVVDRKSGQPIQAQVEIIRQVYQKKDSTVFSQLTNQKGEVVFPEKNVLRNSYYTLVLSKGKDVYKLNSGFYTSYREGDEENSWTKNLKLFTDRSIYRPGQQVFFKGVLTDRKLDTIKVISNKDVSVTFLDVNNREIGHQVFTTNEFGSFAGFYRIPEGLLSGTFSLQTEYGSEYIQVEEYKRPTFEVKSIPIETAFKLGDTIPFKGQAVAYSGANISNAVVKYRVERTSYYPFWRTRSKIRPPYQTESKIITTGETSTDENGFFSISFVAQAGKDLDARYNFSVTVDVIDVSGETRFLTEDIRVSNRSVEPSLEVNSVWEVGKPSSLRLSSKNLQNQPVASTFQIKVYPLTSNESLKKSRYWEDPDQFFLSVADHQKVFPYDIYKDELNDIITKKGKAVWTQNISVSGDTILSNLPQNLPAGFYQVQAVIVEGKDTITLEQEFEVRTVKNISAKKDFIRLEFDQSQYKVGENIVATFISDYKNAYLRADVFFKNKVIETFTTTFDTRVKEWTIPVKPEMLGDVLIQYTLIAENRIFNGSKTVSIPFANKETLKYEWLSFRNKLLPGLKETWKLNIKDTSGKVKDIELLATMYDASLDQFLPHDFNYSIYFPSYARYRYVSNNAFKSAYPASIQGNNFQQYASVASPFYPSLNFFNWSLSSNRYPVYYMARAGAMYKNEMLSESAVIVDKDEVSDSAAPVPAGNMKEEAVEEEAIVESLSEKGIVFRKNFNETAFFYPQLRADKDGNYTIEFTIPEALTTWKFLAFAHTPELNYAIFRDEVVTQKDVMVQLNKPRFVRMGDELYLRARISNLTANGLSTVTKLVIRNAQTNEDITSQVVKSSSDISVDVAAQSNSSVEWHLQIPQELEGIVYEVYTQAGDHTDGESDMIPVLENRILLTESFPIFLNKKGKNELELKDYIHDSGTSQTQSITFEYTSQPVWYALMALPYLNEDKEASALALFNRFYAHSLAAYILKSIPESQKLLEAWKKEGSLRSALEKNQDLKSVVLEATPWLRDAQDETEQMQNLLKLLTGTQDDKNIELLLSKLRDLRGPEGGICWYPGMPSNRFITQGVLLGMYRLQLLGAYDFTEDEDMRIWVSEALAYLSEENTKEFNQIKRNDSSYVKNDHLSAIEANYLYLLSYEKDVQLNEAQQYFLNQARQFVFNKDAQTKAALAIALHRWKDAKLPKDILNSFKQSAVVSKTEGMYWKNNASYFWYQAPIETQALIIEAFQQINNDAKTIDQLKTWLLRQKQTNRWKQPKATVDAVYALLLTGGKWATQKPDVIKYDKKEVKDNDFQLGTGYIQSKWTAAEAPESVLIQKKSKSPSWGAIYHQYYENIDQVKASTKEMSVKRTLYKVVNTDQGETLVPLNGEVNVGDKIRIKLELKFDRDVEFFHLQDTRGSGLEPANVLSGYRYQGGLGFYEQTGDVATHWFIEFAPKGNYILEYTVYANVAGRYSSGTTFGECLYAPEFRFQSNGSMIVVEN